MVTKEPKIYIKTPLKKLKCYIETRDFAGYDPYDALNSPLLKFLGSRNKWVRIAFTQTLKKLPVNVRPILGIRRAHNPKAIGLFLWGYAKLYKVERKPEYLAKIEYLLSLLGKLKSQGYSGNCWGYNFDWQSRASFVPRYTPTIVNSSFIGHALLDTYRYTGIQEALDMAVSIKDFILHDLNRYQENDTQCFSYTPIDNNYVHNANLLGASLLIRLYGILGERELKNNAFAALAYSMKYQHEEGSWYYAEADYQNWIDSFHTGFNLQSIQYFLEEGFVKYEPAFEKGIEFYANKFFLEDGTPKYYHNRIYPIDIHSPAQAVSFFSGLGENYRSLTEKVLHWMLENMLSPKGYFYFRKGSRFTNKIPYMRWSQAWAFHALTSYLINSKQEI